MNPTPFSSGDYETFEFWIYGNGFNGQKIGIQVVLASGGGTPFPTTPVQVSQVLTAGIQPWEWSRVNIPFTMLSLTANSPQDLLGFVLSSDADEFGGRVGIDDVMMGYTLPMCTNNTILMLDDGLAKGYSDQSWGVYTLQSSDTAYSGSYSLAWQMYDTGGIHITGKGVNTKSYAGVSFFLNPQKVQGWQWTVTMTADDSKANNGQAGFAINLMDYYGGHLPQQNGQWVRVVIPFYEFGITSGTTLNGILFQLETNAYQGTLYLDQIEFIQEIDPDTTSGASRIGAGALLFVTLILYSFL